jgi:hypothetical protein
MHVLSEKEVEEMRRSPRFSTKIPCSVTLENGSWTATMLDLSEGGAFIKIREPLGVGEIVTISFDIPGAKKNISFNLRATIVHAGRYLQGFENYSGCGVRFENATPQVIAYLRSILRWNKTAVIGKFVLTA